MDGKGGSGWEGRTPWETPRMSPSKPLWAPATTERSKLLFLQTQVQFCALSCPEVLVFLLIRNCSDVSE